MSKIARDLNIKNIEERVFELEKNPGGISEIPIATSDTIGGVKSGNGFTVNPETGEVTLSVTGEYDEFIANSNSSDDKYKKNVGVISRGTEYVYEHNEFIPKTSEYKVTSINKSEYAPDGYFRSLEPVTQRLNPISDIKINLSDDYVNGIYTNKNGVKVMPIHDSINHICTYDLSQIWQSLDMLKDAGLVINNSGAIEYKTIPDMINYNVSQYDNHEEYPDLPNLVNKKINFNLHYKINNATLINETSCKLRFILNHIERQNNQNGQVILARGFCCQDLANVVQTKEWRKFYTEDYPLIWSKNISKDAIFYVNTDIVDGVYIQEQILDIDITKFANFDYLGGDDINILFQNASVINVENSFGVLTQRATYFKTVKEVEPSE